MIGRAWNLFAYAWFVVFVLNGFTKAAGLGMGDLWLASAPWWIGKLFTVLAWYVLTGSLRSPRQETLKPYRVK